MTVNVEGNYLARGKVGKNGELRFRRDSVEGDELLRALEEDLQVAVYPDK